MQSVSPRFLNAIRTGAKIDVSCTVWENGTYVGVLPVAGGSVSVDGSKVGVRRQLTLETTADQWDALSGFGLELRPFRGISYVDGSVERVPLGVFPIDNVKLSYGASGRCTVAAPDRFARVQGAQFEEPQTTSGRAVAEIARFATEAFAFPVSSETSGASSVVDVTDSMWERDRAAAIAQMCTMAALDSEFDADGTFVVRDIPGMTAQPVWTVNAGERGVMTGAAKERNRQRAFSVVIVTAADIDGFPPFEPVTVEDDDPTSPTYVGGSFGRIPYFYSAPEIADEDQARAAGRGILDRQRANAAQLSLEAVVNPALAVWDTIAATFPDGTTETHLVTGFTVPLSVDGVQTITTRSSEPE